MDTTAAASGTFASARFAPASDDDSCSEAAAIFGSPDPDVDPVDAAAATATATGTAVDVAKTATALGFAPAATAAHPIAGRGEAWVVAAAAGDGGLLAAEARAAGARAAAVDAGELEPVDALPPTNLAVFPLRGDPAVGTVPEPAPGFVPLALVAHADPEEVAGAGVGAGAAVGGFKPVLQDPALSVEETAFKGAVACSNTGAVADFGATAGAAAGATVVGRGGALDVSLTAADALLATSTAAGANAAGAATAAHGFPSTTAPSDFFPFSDAAIMDSAGFLALSVNLSLCPNDPTPLAPAAAGDDETTEPPALDNASFKASRSSEMTGGGFSARASSSSSISVSSSSNSCLRSNFAACSFDKAAPPAAFLFSRSSMSLSFLRTALSFF